MNINELGVEYKSLSKVILHNLQMAFDEYGIELLNFNIEDINFDEKDKTVMEGIAEQARLSKLGVSYLQQKQIDIAQTVAGNEGAGNFMGLGMGIGLGNNLGGMVNDSIRQSGVIPPPPSFSFYIAKEGNTVGPYNMEQLRNMILQKDIFEYTYVYKLGGTSWNLLKDVPELMQLMSSLLPPPPPKNM